MVGTISGLNSVLTYFNIGMKLCNSLR